MTRTIVMSYDHINRIDNDHDFLKINRPPQRPPKCNIQAVLHSCNVFFLKIFSILVSATLSLVCLAKNKKVYGQEVVTWPQTSITFD